jgi:cysteine desulfurase
MEIYLDNAATTSVSQEVLDAMNPYFTNNYGNASSLHEKGFTSRKAMNQAKRKIADLLHCDRKEIYFTSCGTESINWAIKGLAFANPAKSEIITTKIEHHATLHTVAFLEKQGYTIHYLDVDENGFIDTNQLKSLLCDNTLLVSIIYANNEIGTIQDIAEISKICDEASVYLHLDAVQATCHIPMDLTKMNVDCVSISGHKFHAPKGIGILYIKNGTKIENLIHGGQQEFDLRSGTENIPYIIGISTAMENGIKTLDTYQKHLDHLSSILIKTLEENNIDFILNGPPIGKSRLPGNVNISFKDLQGSDITYYLNKKGIYVSTGSACDSKSILPSHVLKAINVPQDYINATIRFSFGLNNTLEEAKYVAKELISIIKK